MILLMEAGGIRWSAPLSSRTAPVSKSTMIALRACVSMPIAAHASVAQPQMARAASPIRIAVFIRPIPPTRPPNLWLGIMPEFWSAGSIHHDPRIGQSRREYAREHPVGVIHGHDRSEPYA